MTTTRSIRAILAATALAALSLAIPAAATAAVPKVWSPNLQRPVYALKARPLGWQPSTWYGPGFYGRRTACGKTLRRKTWGIAHRTLPCGKLVWLRHGRRQVAVPVIDRGPYSGATVDLTERTARRLNFIGKGRGNVRVTVLRRRLPLRRM
jgi:rare lipoprotein A